MSTVIAFLVGMQSTVMAGIEPKMDPGYDDNGLTQTLPPEIELQPAYLIRTFATNALTWSSNSPDPAGIVYDPSTGKLIIVDSEVDEFLPEMSKPNVFYSTLAGELVSTHFTYPTTKETSGVAINPANQHLFFADDDHEKVYEFAPGPDGTFWTADDIKTVKFVGTDAEDVSYGINKIFVAGGGEKEVVIIDLGADGIISDDDITTTVFDTALKGFSDVEGITFDEITGTLFLISTAATETYLGEFNLTGELLNAWDLSFMGATPNIRSGLTFAPASENPAINHIYIVSRGVDNDYPEEHPDEDDGMVWEISLTEPETTETPSPTTETPSPTTETPSPTTITPSPTTITPSPTTETPYPTPETPSPTTVTPTPTDSSVYLPLVLR